jgi:hypothetical protein
MFISFAAIPLGLLIFYGLYDENADYFKKGRFVQNTEGWQYRYNGVVYHYGLMVSEKAAIVVLSITFGLISFVIHEALMIMVIKR